MLIDFKQVGILLAGYLFLTFILLLITVQSNKKSRTMWIVAIMFIILIVLWYLSLNGTIPVCNLLSCG